MTRERPTTIEPDSYDAQADFAGSLDVAYAAVRERVAQGGPTWTPQLRFIDLPATAPRPDGCRQDREE